MPGVAEIVHVSRPFKLSSREVRFEDTRVLIADVPVGAGAPLVVMAGPCSVETAEQTISTAAAVRDAGARVLRGGAYKPSTSPYSFRGLGEPGLEILARARAETGLPIVTEVLTPADVEVVARTADCLQVGARNMQNFDLLKDLGKVRRPVLLKRGIAATLQELLLAAEYIMAGGNKQLILCERGIRTYETSTRNTLDISAIPVVKAMSHLPIVVDPSHSTGLRHLVVPVARAAVAAGADGLIVEVHNQPEKALCDGAQSLLPAQIVELSRQVSGIAQSIGRRFQPVA
jgi:3-deoxy-7-phosphoheptulonate synthase